ncbi:Stk1 family PASTA domain-containing Ser/Thr kinase [Microbacterium sp. YY-03]|uniref:Stk1 family PASTA domain-containing Ser/Thr kinase n=1 Tax=Microbacterium sp. YY-03 TaxID=3421636 RepID=UPI003D17F250
MSPTQPNDPLIGRLVDGRYRVRARIARGGMATVYVATDLRLERRVALKVMHAHLSDDTVFQGRFIQEARAAARLADPHVVNVFDQGQDGELAYLVMEYLPGITLRELLKEQRRLSIAQTITVMDAILSGLAAAHRADIVHRDVKPENVLLAEDGRIKIGDFGLARATTANTASGAQLMGTIAYLAPELVTRGTADARSDIYSLGIMLYEMLAGEQPYRGEQPMQIAFQHATDSVPRPSAKNPGVPEQLDELVLWATEKEPDARPLDAQVMLDQLREIERELGIAPAVTDDEPFTNQTVILDEYDTGGHTSVLPVTGAMSLGLNATGPTAPPAVAADNATRLRRVTVRRRRRSVVALLLVLILAVAAGGAGWFFGSGPGSNVAVPAVVGETYETASARLADTNLVAKRTEAPSLDIAPGSVISSDPKAGTSVKKDSVVTLVVSTGPQQVSVPTTAGQTQESITATLKELGIALPADKIDTEYNAEKAAGEVIWMVIYPRGGGETDYFQCGDTCTAFAGDTARIWVSLGPVVDLVSTPTNLEDARKAITDQQMTVGTVTETYSNDVAEGNIVAMSNNQEDGIYRPGAEVALTVSLGPEPITVPSGIIGASRTDAENILRNAGFNVDYASISIISGDNLEVTGMRLGDSGGQAIESGQSYLPGTTIYLQVKLVI